MPQLPGESEEAFDARWNHTYDDLKNRLRTADADGSPVHQWPKELREEVERSWECVFDRTYFSARDYWQADGKSGGPSPVSPNPPNIEPG